MLRRPQLLPVALVAVLSLLASTCRAQLAGAVWKKGVVWQKGDHFVTMYPETPVRDGDRTLATLAAGAELVAEDVKDDWVLVTVAQGRRQVQGWVYAVHLDDEVGPRLVLYDEGHRAGFVPSGWMPDGRGLAQNVHCEDSPHSGKYCVRTAYRAADNPWAGIAWLLDGAWFPKREFNLYEKLRAHQGDPIVLRFWARSKQGARIEFCAGGGNGDSIRFKLCPFAERMEKLPLLDGKEDSMRLPARDVELSAQWERFQIDLSDADLSHVVQLFASTAASFNAPEIEALFRRPKERSCQEADAEFRETLNRLVVEWDLDDIYVVRARNRPPVPLDRKAIRLGPPIRTPPAPMPVLAPPAPMPRED
jgi:hypothetical protein